MSKLFKVNTLLLLPVLFPESLFILLYVTNAEFRDDWFFQLVGFIFFKIAAVLIVLERFSHYNSHNWEIIPFMSKKPRKTGYIGWPTIIILTVPTVIFILSVILMWNDYVKCPSLFYLVLTLSEIVLILVLCFLKRILKIEVWRNQL